MDIATVIDTIKHLSGEVTVATEVKLQSVYYRTAHLTYGGINDHTTLSGLNFRANYHGEYFLRVSLTHKCPIGFFREKSITKAPYYCKACASCVISAEQGRSFMLPVFPSIIPKMQIEVAGMDYKGNPAKDFDLGSMVLTQFDGWVHKCPKVEYMTKQTITSSPFKCKFCKQIIGEPEFNFDRMRAFATTYQSLYKKGL